MTLAKVFLLGLALSGLLGLLAGAGLHPLVGAVAALAGLGVTLAVWGGWALAQLLGSLARP